MTRVLPSQAVTPSDHGAVVKVVATFCTTMAMIFFLARLWVRWPWRELFGKDDWTVVFANVRNIRAFIRTLTLAHLTRSAASPSSS